MTSPKSDSGSQSAGSDSTSSSTGDVTFGDTSNAEAVVSSARGERDDFHYGDDRAILDPPNWDSQSSHELYNGAITDNEPGTADELGASWNRQGADLSHAADVLYEAITELSGVWVGRASGAAQGALIGVANASSTAGDAAKAMGKRLHEQAMAAAEVKKMPPPKDFNMDRWLAAGLAGGPAAMTLDAKAQRDEADAVKAEQQRYMNAYTKSMSDVDGSTPSFGPDSIGLKPMEGSRYGSGSGSGVGNVAAGPGLSAISSGTGGVGGVGGSAMGLGLGPLGGAGGGTPANVGDVVNAGLQQGQVATGTGHVTTTPSSGLAAGAAVLGGALAAGVGYAGAKAFGKDSQRKSDKQEPEVTEVPEDEATEGADGTEAETPETPQVPDTASVAGGSGQPAPQQRIDVPQFGQPTGYQPQPQAGVGPLPSGPAYVGPQGMNFAPGTPVGPLPDAPVPLAEGAQSGAATPSATPDASATNSVAAGSEHQAHGPAAQGAQAQAMAQQQAAAAGMAPAPMQPMGGAGAAGAGAAGVGGMGAAAGDHEAASYLIQPDPDDVFGPTEAVTSGVIGEDPEDD